MTFARARFSFRAMTNPLPTLAAKAAKLRRLYDDLALLPNAWDAASARAFTDLGFAVLATTSSVVSASLVQRPGADAH